MSRHTPQEIAEEAKRLRHLRVLVDVTGATLRQAELTPEEAVTVIGRCRDSVLELFPGQGQTFDLLYRPRFLRIMRERFGTGSPASDGDPAARFR